MAESVPLIAGGHPIPAASACAVCRSISQSPSQRIWSALFETAFCNGLRFYSTRKRPLIALDISVLCCCASAGHSNPQQLHPRRDARFDAAAQRYVSRQGIRGDVRPDVLSRQDVRLRPPVLGPGGLLLWRYRAAPQGRLHLLHVSRSRARHLEGMQPRVRHGGALWQVDRRVPRSGRALAASAITRPLLPPVRPALARHIVSIICLPMFLSTSSTR